MNFVYGESPETTTSRPSRSRRTSSIRNFAPGGAQITRRSCAPTPTSAETFVHSPADGNAISPISPSQVPYFSEPVRTRGSASLPGVASLRVFTHAESM